MLKVKYFIKELTEARDERNIEKVLNLKYELNHTSCKDFGYTDIKDIVILYEMINDTINFILDINFDKN